MTDRRLGHAFGWKRSTVMVNARRRVSILRSTIYETGRQSGYDMLSALMLNIEETSNRHSIRSYHDHG